MTIIWAALVVVFLIIEGATAGLTSIWFAAGALAALAAAFLDARIWLQIVLFILVSVAMLLLTRPLAKKYVNRKIQPTNADRVIGREATVSEGIDNVAGKGAVTVGGRVWTARSSSGVAIEKGTRVEVKAIEGVKLIVEPLEAAVTAEK
ncbi:MAG: NfeD family protein [Oscillospiraceae bacterium]|nr:NfeD family protein [Oscillospiraceae bacterium]